MSSLNVATTFNTSKDMASIAPALHSLLHAAEPLERDAILYGTGSTDGDGDGTAIDGGFVEWDDREVYCKAMGFERALSTVREALAPHASELIASLAGAGAAHAVVIPSDALSLGTAKERIAAARRLCDDDDAHERVNAARRLRDEQESGVLATVECIAARTDQRAHEATWLGQLKGDRAKLLAFAEPVVRAVATGRPAGFLECMRLNLVLRSFTSVVGRCKLKYVDPLA
jgi:hypothetical protein